MLVAGKAANEKGIPVVLDPVGVGASAYRQHVVDGNLEQVNVQCIRCNVANSLRLPVFIGSQEELIAAMEK